MVSSSSRRSRRNCKKHDKSTSSSRDNESSEEKTMKEVVDKDKKEVNASEKEQSDKKTEEEFDWRKAVRPAWMCKKEFRDWQKLMAAPRPTAEEVNAAIEEGLRNAERAEPVDDDKRRTHNSHSHDCEADDDTSKVDSIVFDSAEELERYQRILRKSAENGVLNVESAPSESKDRDKMEGACIGLRSRETVDEMLKPGQFYLYYEKPSGTDIPVMIQLKIGFMSDQKSIYHFPIQRFQCQGESYYGVMHTDTDVKMFHSIDSLVEHYRISAHKGSLILPV